MIYRQPDPQAQPGLYTVNTVAIPAAPLIPVQQIHQSTTDPASAVSRAAYPVPDSFMYRLPPLRWR